MIDVEDIRKRLLVLGVLVLLPEELTLPAEYAERDELGREKAKGERGLHLYLREVAPQGYIQLYDPPMGYTLNGWADNQPLQIDTIATTRTLAFSLAYLVRDELAATPRKGGRRQTTTPPFVLSADRVSARVTQRFNVRDPYFKGSNL